MLDFLKQKLVITVLLGVSLVLAGCGGDNVFTAGGCNPADTPTDIERFFVSSASTTTGGLQKIIDNDTNDFSLGWDLTSSCSYTYAIYLSENSELGVDDIEFASGTCGIGYSCDYSPDIDCDYNSTDQTMACSGDPAVDVSAALPGASPQTPYIIFTASNEMSDQPDPVSQQVQVEF